MTTNATSGDGTPVDPIAGLVKQFITDYQVPRILKGERPALRAVFQQYHGTAHGTFSVLPNLAPELRVGVFAHEAFPVWVRFSADPGSNYVNGIGIKLFGVPGPKLLEPDAPTQDFLMQNAPRFFADDAQSMYDFGENPDTFPKRAEADAILAEMNVRRGSVLKIAYWSGLPSRFGAGRYVKYKLVPDGADEPPAGNTAPDYLAEDLRSRLRRGEARFTFCAQFQTDPEKMPLDRATVTWDESASPPVPLATLLLPKQDLKARGSDEYAENLSFNAWHSLPEHEPAGSIQAARRVVYAKGAEARRFANGVPNFEPRAPRPDAPPYPTAPE